MTIATPGRANSVTIATLHTKSRPRILVASKAAFPEYFLAVSTWILNGSPIECHVEEAGRFKVLGENLLGTGAVENELSTQ